MKNAGQRLFFLIILISVSLWIIGKEDLSILSDQPLRALAQFSAIVGASGFLLEYVLSSRLPFVEKYLMPLDKSYRLHRIVGTFTAVGVILHVSSLISNLLPSVGAVSLYLVPGKILSYDLGIFAFYGLLLLVITTIYMKIPYNIWKTVHIVTGFVLPLVVLHIFLIPSDISQGTILKWWFLFLSGIALFSWGYRLIIYRLFVFKNRYVVTEVIRDADATILTLEATGMPVPVHPGQFLFFRFMAQSKRVSGESHPFSIMKNQGKSITIAAKDLGDYSATLTQLEIGDIAVVSPAYGAFGASFTGSRKPAVWVAGGIGVIPFINLLQKMKEAEDKRDVYFYYSTKEQDQRFLSIIDSLKQGTHVNLYYTCTSQKGRKSPGSALSELTQAPYKYEYFLCGPRPMITDWEEHLKKIGITSDAIHYEDFDFKDLIV